MLKQREKGSASPSQGGQILLVVILVIIIASTIGLSLASRSITSLRTSTEEAESQKALSAAEAGIERTIQNNVPVAIGDNLTNNSSYSTQVTPIDSSSFLINGGNIIPKDEGADVWLVGRNADGTPDYSTSLSPQFLHLYWTSSSEVCDSPAAPAAVQAIAVSRDTSPPNEIKTYRYAFDSCPNRRSENNFTLPATGSFNIGGRAFTIRTPEGSTALAKNVQNIIFLRVIPIYKDAVIGVDTCNPGGNNCTPLPSQGYIISSIGISGSANRKITVFKGYPQAYLPYLSYGLFVVN